LIPYNLYKRAVRVLKEAVGKRPTYVAVKPDLDSIETIVEVCEVIGLPSHMMVGETDLHATVTYSREPISDPTKVLKEFMPIRACGDDLTFFKSRDGKQCLVLKLSSVGMRAAHTAIKKTGASHDFPTFEAHVTLCYDTPADYVKRIKRASKPNVNLLFTEYEVKELDLDWKP
jgi:hypothetical protein